MLPEVLSSVPFDGDKYNLSTEISEGSKYGY